MPLLIVCGYPCSGKSSVVKHIVLNLQLRFPQFVVKVVPEPVPPSGQDFGDDVRKDIYADSRKERELRGQHKSEVERTLTLPIEDTKNQGNRTLVVLMDAGNYIKGYRYELYCLAKSLKHQHCVIYCDTPLENVIEWNARINRYPDTLLKDMISRFEAPQASQRWDRPLISLNPSLWPSADEINVDSVMNELTDLVFTPGGASVRPNRSTQLPVLCPTEFLQEIERTTQVVVDHILSCQSMSAQFAGLPPSLKPATGEKSNVLKSDVRLSLVDRQRKFTMGDLVRAKRRYIGLKRTKLPDSTTVPSALSVAEEFLRFLSVSDEGSNVFADS